MDQSIHCFLLILFFFPDPTGFAFIDNGLAIELVYIGGPGSCRVDITPEFIVADFELDTECVVDFRFCGPFCGLFIPSVDLIDDGSNDVIEIVFGEIEFPIDVTIELIHETDGFESLLIGPLLVSPSLSQTIDFPVACPVAVYSKPCVENEIINIGIDGTGNSQFSIGSITVTQAQIVGGTIIPIDTTALLVAGFNANSIWMIPTVLGIAGAGFIIFKLKRK